MSNITTIAHSGAVVRQQQEEQPSDLQGFSALPQPILEMILIPGTSSKCKKALRQTCK